MSEPSGDEYARSDEEGAVDQDQICTPDVGPRVCYRMDDQDRTIQAEEQYPVDEDEAARRTPLQTPPRQDTEDRGSEDDRTAQ